jgi:hypothetical protein
VDADYSCLVSLPRNIHRRKCASTVTSTSTSRLFTMRTNAAKRSTRIGTGVMFTQRTCICTNLMVFETEILRVSSKSCLCFHGWGDALPYVAGRRAEFFRTEFSKLGLAASTQNYTFSTSKGVSFYPPWLSVMQTLARLSQATTHTL